MKRFERNWATIALLQQYLNNQIRIGRRNGTIPKRGEGGDERQEGAPHPGRKRKQDDASSSSDEDDDWPNSDSDTDKDNTPQPPKAKRAKIAASKGKACATMLEMDAWNDDNQGAESSDENDN